MDHFHNDRRVLALARLKILLTTALLCVVWTVVVAARNKVPLLLKAVLLETTVVEDARMHWASTPRTIAFDVSRCFR